MKSVGVWGGRVLGFSGLGPTTGTTLHGLVLAGSMGHEPANGDGCAGPLAWIGWLNLGGAVAGLLGLRYGWG